METFGLLLKSYAGDLAYANRLIASFISHNPTGLTLHCVVPASDLDLFRPSCTDEVVLHAEEDLVGGHLVSEPIGGLRVGYANQEIVKLAFWEAGLVANYFCVDSDAVFVRDIARSDFMHDERTPYTVLVEDNELKADPGYFRDHWIGRERSIQLIADEFSLKEKVLKTSHGHQVMSSLALRRLRDDFLAPRGWEYKDLLTISPYEFSWYALWLQAAQPIPVYQREPFVKVFHNEDQYLAAVLAGVSNEDLARGYLAVVVNSNFSRDLGPLKLGGDKVTSLVSHFSYAEVGRLLCAKLRDTTRRRLLRRKSP